MWFLPEILIIAICSGGAYVLAGIQVDSLILKKGELGSISLPRQAGVAIVNYVKGMISVFLPTIWCILSLNQNLLYHMYIMAFVGAFLPIMSKWPRFRIATVLGQLSVLMLIIELQRYGFVYALLTSAVWFLTAFISRYAFVATAVLAVLMLYLSIYYYTSWVPPSCALDATCLYHPPFYVSRAVWLIALPALILLWDAWKGFTRALRGEEPQFLSVFWDRFADKKP